MIRIGHFFDALFCLFVAYCFVMPNQLKVIHEEDPNYWHHGRKDSCQRNPTRELVIIDRLHLKSYVLEIIDRLPQDTEEEYGVEKPIAQAIVDLEDLTNE